MLLFQDFAKFRISSHQVSLAPSFQLQRRPRKGKLVTWNPLITCPMKVRKRVNNSPFLFGTSKFSGFLPSLDWRFHATLSIFRKVPVWIDLGISERNGSTFWKPKGTNTLNFPWKMAIFIIRIESRSSYPICSGTNGQRTKQTWDSWVGISFTIPVGGTQDHFDGREE